MDDEDDDISVTMVSFGDIEWQRWMIYHRGRDRWWGHGAWRIRQRDGEVWQSFYEAKHEWRNAVWLADRCDLEDE